MFRLILSLSLALLSTSFVVSAPAAADAQVSRAGSSYVPVYGYENDSRHRWNERTCCRREERGGYRIFWSNFGECHRTRGETAPNRTCRKHGGFHRYPGRSWGDDGWQQGDWNKRTCCRREERGGYRIFWSTFGECDRTRGETAPNRTCRKHGGFHRYPGRSWGDDGWQQGDWNVRWCCTRGGQVWWSTRGECVRAGGQQAANRVCRRN
jgi:hypothetical protein